MASDVLTGLRALEAVYCGFISLRGDAAMERSPLRVRNSNIMSGDTYIFRWDRHGRKGQPCLVLARHDEQLPRQVRGRLHDGHLAQRSAEAP
jgi:hypothetical protein